MELVFDHVTKFYGPVVGVNDVALRFGPGVTGLLGANGAGKSTLLKLASGQLRPNLGRVRVGGHSARSTAARRLMGYCPDSPSLEDALTGRQFVWNMARLHGYARAECRERTERALALVGMGDRADRRIAGFSHGMRQRVKLAQAILHDPPILLLDEPLTGIDPGGRREFKTLLAQLAAAGKTVIVSTHLLDEIEDLASAIVLMGRGRVIAEGAIDQIRSRIEDQPLTVAVASDQPRALAAAMAAAEDVRTLSVDGDTLTLRTSDPRAFFRRMEDIGCGGAIQVLSMRVLDDGADAVFGYLTSKGRG